MSSDSPSNWLLKNTPSPSPRSSRYPNLTRRTRSPRSVNSTRSSRSPKSLSSPRSPSPKVKIGFYRNFRNKLLAKTMNVNKEIAKLNHKKDLLLTQINNSLYKREWLTQTSNGAIIGLEYIPESKYLLYPSESQLNKSTVKSFFPLKCSEFDRFLVFKAIIHSNDERTMGYEKIDIDFLQPSFLHRLNPLTSNPNVRRLVNRMKEYNKLVKKSKTKGGRKLTMKKKNKTN
jgi:hypothetical protein